MKVRDVSFRSSERSLWGTISAAENPSGAGVLFLPGYHSNRKGYAEYGDALTTELGATCLSVDLSGQGDSEGKLRNLVTGDHVADTVVAYDLLSSQEEVDSKRIGVVGASYSGMLAVMLCRERSPKSLVLRAPAIHEKLPETIPDQPSPDETAEKLGLALPPNGVLKTINDFEGEITIVESEHDISVLPDDIKVLMRVARRGQCLFLPDAAHVLKGEVRNAYRDMLIDWAQRL